jgi:type I restriction enzyme S subunit
MKILQPTLRFPEFKKGWEIKTLRDIASLVTKGTTPKKFVPKGINFIKIECLNGHDIDITKCLFIDEETQNKELKRSILKENDLLFAIAGATIGKCTIVNKNILPANTNQALSIIRLNDLENKDYIFQVLTSDRMSKYIIDNISVGAQPNLNLEQINSFSFSYPSLSEQQKIASFLSSTDEKLKVLKKKLSLLEKYKKGVMQQIFSQETRFKNDSDNYSDWEVKTLGEVIIKNSKKNKNQEFKLVQSVSNTRGFVNQTEYFEDRVIASKDLSNYYVIQKGNFAYNPSRIDVGSLAYKNDDETAVISPLYISFSTNKNYLLDHFLLNWFTVQEFIKQMNSSFEGSVRNTLSFESLSRMTITFPSIEEQRKIANFLSAIEIKINNCKCQIEKLEVWKKGLLQQMFC